MQLKRTVQANKKHPAAHLKKVLEKPCSIFWTEKEQDTFFKMLKKHGKDYELPNSRTGLYVKSNNMVSFGTKD